LEKQNQKQDLQHRGREEAEELMEETKKLANKAKQNSIPRGYGGYGEGFEIGKAKPKARPPTQRKGGSRETDGGNQKTGK
jgi:hypothetical protein